MASFALENGMVIGDPRELESMIQWTMETLIVLKEMKNGVVVK